MVAPLAMLGILGAGSVGATLMKDWAEDRDINRASRRREGINMGAGPDAIAAELFQRGMLDPSTLMQTGFQQLGRQEQFGLNQALESQRQEPIWARLGLDTMRQQFDQRTKLLGMSEYGGDLSYSPTDMIIAGLQGVESGGFDDPWQAVGQMVPEGQYAGEQAIGPLQIMPGNIAQWTQEALGQAWDPTQMALGIRQGDEGARQAYMDTVRHKIDQWRRQGYSDQDIASLWHSGRPLKASMSAQDLANGLPTQGGPDSFVGRFSANMGRAAQGQADEAAFRETDLAGIDAERPFLDRAGVVDTVIQSLPFWQRGGRLRNDEQKAQADQGRRAAEEVFHQWRKDVYGEAEPSPQALKDFREIFRMPGDKLEDRERTKRYFQTMRAELVRKAEYERARVLYKAGFIGRGQLDSLNGGRLTREEKAAIAKGEAVAPAGFTERVQ